MFMRQSALSPFDALSARSRSTTCSRSRISFGLVWCFVSQPFRSQSDKLIVSPNNEQPRFFQDSRQEMVLRPKLCSELARRVDGWIDVSPESRLSGGQRSHDVVKGRVPYDEQVDIACRPELAASGRPKHEGDDDLLAE
jgi:hypothetical protein